VLLLGEGHAWGMEKRAGAWTFLGLSSSGEIIAGDRWRCQRCHAEAVADSLFGLPFPTAAEALQGCAGATSRDAEF
jgi:hypothetical protein